MLFISINLSIIKVFLNKRVFCLLKLEILTDRKTIKTITVVIHSLILSMQRMSHFVANYFNNGDT